MTVAFPNTSAWYSYGIGTRQRAAITAAATADAGSPVTFAATSTLREHVVVGDGGRLRANGDRGDVLEGHLPAGGRVDQQVPRAR